MLNDNIAEALELLTLPPFVYVLPDGGDGLVVHVEGRPFGFVDDSDSSCSPVRYDPQYTAADIADHILNLAADMVAIVYQASVKCGGEPWQQRHGERTINVNPAPVSVPAPIVNVRVDAPIVHIAPPTFDMPAPVVNIEPAQIHIPAARSVRKRVVRDKDGALVGLVEVDEPDAG